MKSLPVTLGLPNDVESLEAWLKDPEKEVEVTAAKDAIRALRDYLAWLGTMPAPKDEMVVLSSIAEACDAALDVLDSTIGESRQQLEDFFV